MDPFAPQSSSIMSIPGIKNLGAHVIVSEIGIDAEPVPFGRASHLVGWHMSAQRRECRQASINLACAKKCSMAQNDAGAVRLGSGKKEKQLPTGPMVYRIKARRGPKKAIMAVVASILTAIYPMLKDGTMYKDLGCNHFDLRRSTDKQKQRLVKRLAELGYVVEIKPIAA